MGIGAAVLAGVSAGLQLYQGEEARKQARRAGRRQAAALRAEAAAERQRSIRLAAAQRAQYGAAGVGGQGSPLFVTAQSLLEGIRTRNRIIMGARAARANAYAQGDAARLQAISGAINTIGSGISAYRAG